MYQYVERIFIASACGLMFAILLYEIFGHTVAVAVALLLYVTGATLLLSTAALILMSLLTPFVRHIRRSSWFGLLMNLALAATTGLFVWYVMQPSMWWQLQYFGLSMSLLAMTCFGYVSWNTARHEREQRWIDARKSEMRQLLAERKARHQPRPAWHQRRVTWLVAGLASRVVQRWITGQ